MNGFISPIDFEHPLLIAAGALFFIQLCYQLWLYNRINLRARAVKREEVHFTSELPPLSVIITAHDEEDALRRNLESILQQDYPDFEVIVINHSLTAGPADTAPDAAAEYLTQLSDRYPNLYHSFVPATSRYISRKKLAITLGIKASRHEWLVFTDADCKPAGNQWLRTMARNFTTRTEVVLGYSGYQSGEAEGGGISWLGFRAAYHNLFSSMRYLGFALAGYPYMGIGHNLAYRKSVYYAQKGFSAHLNLQRGDDDLFINQIARRSNTRVETDAQAIVRRELPASGRQWNNSRVARLSTTNLLKGAQRYLAGGETMTRLLFHAAWIGLLVLSISQRYGTIALLAVALFACKYLVQAAVTYFTAKNLEESHSWGFVLLQPLFDLLQPLQVAYWQIRLIMQGKRNFLRK